LTDQQKKIRKKIKRALHVIYFIGIMQTLRNKVKIYGAIRPVEYFNNFKSEAEKETEKEKATPKKLGILVIFLSLESSSNIFFEAIGSNEYI